MKNKWIKLIIKLCTMCIIFYLISSITTKYKIIQIPNEMIDFQFNIITVVSVFAGFSFSVLGILLSLSSTETMHKLKETTVLERNCSKISQSIVMFIISFMISMIFILGIDKFFEKCFSILTVIDAFQQIFIIGLCFMLAGVIYFAISLYNMVIMMNYIFLNERKSVKKKISEYNESVELFRKNKDLQDNDNTE